MNCCHCEKPIEIPQRVYRNVDCYGSQSFNLRCRHCKKINLVGFKRIVKVVSINKSNQDYDDFGR